MSDNEPVSSWVEFRAVYKFPARPFDSKEVRERGFLVDKTLDFKTRNEAAREALLETDAEVIGYEESVVTRSAWKTSV